MPYIAQEKRDELDHSIQLIVDQLCKLEGDDVSNVMPGNINYVFTRILAKLYSDPRYVEMNEVMGILACVQAEYYRRVAGPYENQKLHDNGDMY